LLASCGSSKTEEPAKKPEVKTNENEVELTVEQEKNAGVQIGALSQQSISSVLKVNGKIDVPPQNKVTISVPMGGYLKSTKLLPGMHVGKGEVIAVIEDQQYIQMQQNYLTVKADLVYSESEFNRQRDLNQSKAASDKVFEQARAVFQKQTVEAKALEQKLRLIGIDPVKLTANNISKSINVYSPIDGYVSEVKVNIGKYVSPSDVLFELVNPTDIHLALTVFEKDVNKLSIGQKVIAYTNTNPEKKYPCEIVLISKNLSDDRASEVHCHFERYDKTLLPGMYMNADIEIAGNRVNAIADDAIVRFENKQYVFVERGSHKYAMQEVQVSTSENGFTALTGADSLSGKRIVVKGAYNLLMTMKNTGEEE
jgi:cobalt-zinc-cadmium efflux system membrane fusion protein